MGFKDLLDIYDGETEDLFSLPAIEEIKQSDEIVANEEQSTLVDVQPETTMNQPVVHNDDQPSLEVDRTEDAVESKETDDEIVNDELPEEEEEFLASDGDEYFEFEEEEEEELEEVEELDKDSGQIVKRSVRVTEQVKSERIRKFIDSLETMDRLPLLEGNDLYRPITAERILDKYPKLDVDLKRVFKNRTAGGTLDDEILAKRVLHLFCPTQYSKLLLASERYGIRNIFWHIFVYEGIHFRQYDAERGIASLVNFLEEFRKFWLTAKKLTPAKDLKDGDVLYKRRVVVDKGIDVKYTLQPFAAWCTNTDYHLREVKEIEFVIGHTEPFKLEKLVEKAVARANGNTMDDWMWILKGFSGQFPTSSWWTVDGKRTLLPGIGGEAKRLIYQKFVGWYLTNMDKVAEYFRSKSRVPRTPLLLSDLSTGIRRQVTDEIKKQVKGEYGRESVVLKWKGKFFSVPSMCTYIDGPIKEFILSATGEDLYRLELGLEEYDYEFYVGRLNRQPIIIEPAYRDPSEIQEDDIVFYEQASLF